MIRRLLAAAALLLCAGAVFAARSASDWQYERSMEERAQSLLADLLGPGRGRVAVRVQRRSAASARESQQEGLFDRVMRNIHDAPPVLPGYALPRSLKDEILKAYAPPAPATPEPALALTLTLDTGVPDDRVQPALDALTELLDLDSRRGDSVKVLRGDLLPKAPPPPPPSRTGAWAAAAGAALLLPLGLWAWRRGKAAEPAPGPPPPPPPAPPRPRVDPLLLARVWARLQRRKPAAPPSAEDLALFQRLPAADPQALRTCLCVFTGRELAAAFGDCTEEALSAALAAFPEPVRAEVSAAREEAPAGAAERDALRAEILSRWRRLAAEGRVAPLALVLALFLCGCAGAQRRVEIPVPSPRDLSRFDVGPAALPMSERVAAPMTVSKAEAAPPPSAEETPEEAPAPAKPEGEGLRRLAALFEEVGMGQGKSREEELTADDSPGGQLARAAVYAYVQKENLKAVLLAQAALGDDPGSETRRILLLVLSRRTGIDSEPEGILPLAGLVQHELRKAETAFFDQRFGAAVQASRRALLLAPEDARAWQRLASAEYALGMEKEAREAYLHALKLEPGDAHLRRFLSEKGWK